MKATTVVALLLHLTCYLSQERFRVSAYISDPWRQRLPACSPLVPSSSILGDLSSVVSRRSRSIDRLRSSFAPSSRIKINDCHISAALKATPSRRFSENEEGEEEDVDNVIRRKPKASSDDVTSTFDLDPLVVDTSLSFRRISWLSWWSQVILTTVSSVTLLFARNVVVARRGGVAISGTSVFWLAGWGIVASLTSIVWTWGGARLSRRLLRKATTRVSAANMARRAIRIGILINLIGMGLTLLGAEQIVGGLAIKVLTQQPQAAMSAFLPQPSALIQTVEPLDILVVQANTNTLFSHFCSLTSLLYLTRWTTALDPPSVDQKERPR